MVSSAMYGPFEQYTPTPIGNSANWLTTVVLGELAIALCIIAVAIIGLLLMSGRLAIRRGALVALGCFIVLGAPILASAFVNVAETGRTSDGYRSASPVKREPARNLPPSSYDPYAGASMRDDR